MASYEICRFCKYEGMLLLSEPCSSCMQDAIKFELADNTTTWLGSYTPYQCEKCGFHVDSKTRYCPECGRKAVNYNG